MIRTNKAVDWACRLMMPVGLLVMLLGYFNYYQIKRQLVSPLIPRSTITEIFDLEFDSFFKATLTAAILFLAGLWLFSFDKKKTALAFFILVPVSYFILTRM